MNPGPPSGQRRVYGNDERFLLTPACRDRPSPLAAIVLTTLGFLVGCGTPGVPRPPSLDLPEPVSTLTAARTADTVQLQWTMTHRTTDKLPLKGSVGVRICRALEASACVEVADQPFAPGTPAIFEDRLPPQLTSGPPRLLTYSVQLLNHAGHSAGASNPAYSAAGTAPAPLTGLAAEVRADGVLLRWAPAQPGGPQGSVRIVRVGAESGSLAKGEKKPKPQEALLDPTAPEKERAAKEQTLSVRASASIRALDKDAAFDRNYTYSAQRQQQTTLDGHAIVVAGALSDKISVSTRDTFPPATPTGLVAIAVSEEKSIDLSWTPDTESDLAGYIIYRRDMGVGMQPRRLTPSPIAAAAIRDQNAAPGRKYAYSVAAVDADGNESPRGPEVLEGLPSQ